MLDEKFRRRVAELAGSDADRLDDGARERILRRVVAEGPSLAVRARRIRTAGLVAAPLLAAAAIAVLLVGRRPASHEAKLPAAAPNPLVCAGRSVPESAKNGFVRDQF